MKKFVGVLLTIILVLSTTITAFAETTQTNYLYEDKFFKCYVEGKDVAWKYKEVYYHHTESEDVDWCLIYGRASNISRDANLFLKFDDFILYSPDIVRPFDMKYAVYDVKNDMYVDLVKDYDNLGQYEGLVDVLRELDESIMFGDSDRDGELTILDSTRIQRDIAQLERLWDYYTDRRDIEGRFSDFDDDGNTTILDATAIQMKLAKVE